MNTDPNPNLPDLFPVVKRKKRRAFKLGANPVTPFVNASVGGNEGDSSDPRPEFKISWEDQQQGIKVLVQERENGHLIAEVFSNNAALLNDAAVSVGLMGTMGAHPISKLILLKVPEANGCSGSANFGPLANVVKELGPQLAAAVMLVV